MAKAASLKPKNKKGVVDDDVAQAVELMQSYTTTKIKQDNKNTIIQELFEAGFNVKTLKGPRKLSSKKIQQVMAKYMNRIKPLDFVIHITGATEVKEKIVSGCVSQVMDMGGYIKTLRDKGGVFFNSGLFGDGLLQIGTDDTNANIPIIFNPISNSNIYVDSFGTSMRRGRGRGVTEMCVVFSYDVKTAKRLFPDIDEDDLKGKLPRDSSVYKELERTYEETTKSNKDVAEVGYYYNINDGSYVVFAGTKATLISKLTGDDYPFEMDGQRYIPVSQFLFDPSSEGFWNHGLGDMLYDLAIITRELMNMEVAHAEDSTYPIELVSVPHGEQAKFFNKLKLAHEMRAQGKKGFVAMGYDPANPSSGVKSQTLTTQNLLGEWNNIMDRLDREFSRFGINLDEADRGSSMTATQILAEEEAQSARIKQTMEYNATETKFIVDVTIDYIKKFIKKNNKTPLHLTTSFTMQELQDSVPDNGKPKLPLKEPNKKADLSGLTLGALSDELRKQEGKVFVRVNSRTGAIPSNTLQQTQVIRMLQSSPPGSAAWGKLTHQLAQLNDRDLSMEDFMPQQEAPPQAGPPPEEGPPVAETERAQTDPRTGAMAPAL